MIIGNGDIARVLHDLPAGRRVRKGWIFFASGVSNSKEKDEKAYQREIDLLLSQDKTRHIVYFSTLSVFYRNTRYTRHKKYMEQLIKKQFKTHTIMRLGNITWGSNPHTLINHFKKQHKNGETLDIWDTYRYLVDKRELLHWINLIPAWSCEMNVTGKRMKVRSIVREYVYRAKK